MEALPTRKVYVLSGWDKRSLNPGQNYGIHPAHLVYQLAMPTVLVLEFDINLGWFPTTVEQYWNNNQWRLAPIDAHAYAYSFAWHGVVDDGTEAMEKCELLGQRCYGGSSVSGLDQHFLDLCNDGEEPVWAWLESRFTEFRAQQQEQLEMLRNWT